MLGTYRDKTEFNKKTQNRLPVQEHDIERSNMLKVVLICCVLQCDR
jgi:hypothetical protein